MKRILFAIAGIALALALPGASSALAIARILAVSTVDQAILSQSAIGDIVPIKTEAQAQNGQVDPEKITVYVTRTGTKYHRAECRYLSKSKIPMSLKDAARKYEPCKVCRPPVLRQR